MGTPRLIALFFLAVGLYLLGHDVANLITHPSTPPESLGALWNRTDPGSLSGIQSFIESHILPAIWDPGFTTLLRLPAWTTPLGIGLLVLIGDVFSQRRGRRPRQ